MYSYPSYQHTKNLGNFIELGKFSALVGIKLRNVLFKALEELTRTTSVDSVKTPNGIKNCVIVV